MENARRRVRQEPLNYISASLFGCADVFALISICLPYWLTSSSDGTMHVGLLRTCLEVLERNPVCYTPDDISPEWILTCLFIVIGIIGLTVATGANIYSFFRHPLEAQTITRFAGLVAIIFFNLAQIVFPSAFGQDQIGGTAFQLPANFKIGSCYVFFCISHWLCVISELCAAKICRPRWQF